MVEFICIRLIALLTEGGLLDFAFLYETAFFSKTFYASKSSFFHFRNNVRASDNDSTKSDELLNMCWVKFSYTVDFL